RRGSPVPIYGGYLVAQPKPVTARAVAPALNVDEVVVRPCLISGPAQKPSLSSDSMEKWAPGSLRAPVAPTLDVDKVVERPCPNFGSSSKPSLSHRAGQGERMVSTNAAAFVDPNSDDDPVTFSEMYAKFRRGEPRSSLDDECYTDDAYPQRVSAFLSPMEFRPSSISTAFIVLHASSETNLSDADSNAEEALETPPLGTPSSSLPSLDPST
ncbi:hypothetical protein B0H14DRAFT_2745939, partial [Mycena olivaceomarginata]